MYRLLGLHLQMVKDKDWQGSQHYFCSLMSSVMAYGRPKYESKMRQHIQWSFTHLNLNYPKLQLNETFLVSFIVHVCFPLILMGDNGQSIQTLLLNYRPQQSQSWGFRSHSTAIVILGEVLSMVTCGSGIHTEVTACD